MMSILCWLFTPGDGAFPDVIDIASDSHWKKKWVFLFQHLSVTISFLTMSRTLLPFPVLGDGSLSVSTCMGLVDIATISVLSC